MFIVFWYILRIEIDLVNSFSSISRFLNTYPAKRSWHLRFKPVCASTELELSRWLKDRPFKNNNSRAFIAQRQNFGKGQFGRPWDSPFGGVWLSAALPFEQSIHSPELLGLAVAVAMANTIQPECEQVPIKIKWPNDLIVLDRKLAGILPRVITRGEVIKYVRIGIGINVCNRVSSKAINLKQILARDNISIAKWAAKTLISLDQAIELTKDPKSLCNQGEKMLWNKKFLDSTTSETWQIDGLNFNGSLKLRRGLRRKSISRWN